MCARIYGLRTLQRLSGAISSKITNIESGWVFNFTVCCSARIYSTSQQCVWTAPIGNREYINARRSHQRQEQSPSLQRIAFFVRLQCGIVCTKTGCRVCNKQCCATCDPIKLHHPICCCAMRCRESNCNICQAHYTHNRLVWWCGRSYAYPYTRSCRLTLMCVYKNQHMCKHMHTFIAAI